MKIYIFDSNHNMVADFMDKGPGIRYFRTRGWGRISSEMDNPDKVFDEIEELLTNLVKGHESNQDKCLELLNEAWNEH